MKNRIKLDENEASGINPLVGSFMYNWFYIWQTCVFFSNIQPNNADECISSHIIEIEEGYSNTKV